MRDPRDRDPKHRHAEGDYAAPLAAGSTAHFAPGDRVCYVPSPGAAPLPVTWDVVLEPDDRLRIAYRGTGTGTVTVAVDESDDPNPEE